MNIKEQAYKYALKNALEHNGKADFKAVVGKLMALDKDLSKELSKHVKDITEQIEKVNAMTFEEQEKEFKQFEGKIELKPQEQRTGLKEMDWAGKEQVVTRFAPNPNGPPHLGSARAIIFSYEYAKKYNGKFILRFDDTDPKIKKPVKDPEKLFLEDFDWLGVKVDEIYYASDRIELYYSFMKKMIEMGKAYVCTCEKEKWKKAIDAKKACPCREQTAEEQMKKFEKMLSNEFKEEEAVLRLKTDLKSKDPSMRDWWMAKIVDHPNHPRVGDKYKVWPSYNLASAIDDHELGVTLIIRGQEHAQNAEKQKILYKYLEWIYPHAIHYGRISVPGMVLSTSAIMKGIQDGTFNGWDDPRTGTLRAFRRRGFDERAIKEVIMDLGIKSSDTSISMKSLIALNKKFIDPLSERFTFIEEPAELEIEFIPENTVIEKPLHPDFPGEGNKRFELGVREKFFVSKKDLAKLKEGETIRLRHAFNVRLNKKTDEFRAIGQFVSMARVEGKTIIPWILRETDASLLMADASKKYGMIEREAAEKKLGSHVQLDGIGYARIDSIEGNKVELWFTHT